MGHGNHWEAVASNLDTLWDSFLPTIAEKGRSAGESEFDQPLETGGTRREKAYAITYPDTPLRYLVLVTTDSSGPKPVNEACSAYPYCAEGMVNRICVVKVKSEEDQLEGILRGTTRGGASVTFFDPDFFKNRNCYQTGKAYDFSFAGIAYLLRKTTRDKFTVSEGPALELERQRLLKLNPNADVSQVTSVEFSLAELRYLTPCEDAKDDAEFRTIIDEVGYFEAQGIGFYRIRAVLMLPDEQPFTGYIYASEKVLAGYRPQKGDSIEGIVWLQGRLVSEQQYEPEPDMIAGEAPMLPFSGLLLESGYAKAFTGLHPGLNALGRTLICSGGEVYTYNNPDNSRDIPVFRHLKDGRETDIWARAAIIGQEPEPVFTDEEKTCFVQESKSRGRDAAILLIRCKDIGKGFTIAYTGLDSLEKSAQRMKLDYISKEELNEVAE